MRHSSKCLVLLLGSVVVSASPTYAQTKTACQLLSKADAEAVVGTTLQPPKPTAPFRSLLDPDFTKGTPDQGCMFTNYVPGQPNPPKSVTFMLEVRYSPTPDPSAIDEARKQVDTRTYDHPTDLGGLGDAAFWIGPPNNVTLFVFLGGTTRLMIGPTDIGLDEEKALAAKAVAALRPTGFSYGTQSSTFTRPALVNPGPSQTPLDRLKSALAAKADAGNAQAQLALGDLYQYGGLAPNGTAQPNYAGAAYWYRQASDHGQARASYQLANLYHAGLGVPADASQSFQLLQKAAEAKYVPAMSLLSESYAEMKTPTSAERATDWATQAADAGDSQGWLILGSEYETGKLGGDPLYWYQKAMESYTKAASGGNCLAMMAIGDLYAAGRGVSTDQAQAQSWHAKAQSCEGGDLAALRQQIAQYKTRAAAQRDPALYPVLAALPDIGNPGQAAANNPRVPAQTRGADNSGFGPAITDGLIAAAAIYVVLRLMYPDSSSGAAADNGGNMAAQQQQIINMGRAMACVGQGGTPNLGGFGPPCNY